MHNSACMISTKIRFATVLASVGLTAALLSVPVRAQQGEWADLLPDESLKGWTRVPIPAISGVNPKMQWRVDAGQRTLICSGEGGHEWLRLNRELGDFILQVDWRFTPRGPEETKYNSGIGVRMTKSGDIWHQAQTGAGRPHHDGRERRGGERTHRGRLAPRLHRAGGGGFRDHVQESQGEDTGVRSRAGGGTWSHSGISC